MTDLELGPASDQPHPLQTRNDLVRPPRPRFALPRSISSTYIITTTPTFASSSTTTTTSNLTTSSTLLYQQLLSLPHSQSAKPKLKPRLQARHHPKDIRPGSIRRHTLQPMMVDPAPINPGHPIPGTPPHNRNGISGSPPITPPLASRALPQPHYGYHTLVDRQRPKLNPEQSYFSLPARPALHRHRRDSNDSDCTIRPGTPKATVNVRGGNGTTSDVDSDPFAFASNGSSTTQAPPPSHAHPLTRDIIRIPNYPWAAPLLSSSSTSTQPQSPLLEEFPISQLHPLLQPNARCGFPCFPEELGLYIESDRYLLEEDEYPDSPIRDFRAGVDNDLFTRLSLRGPADSSPQVITNLHSAAKGLDAQAGQKPSTATATSPFSPRLYSTILKHLNHGQREQKTSKSSSKVTKRPSHQKVHSHSYNKIDDPLTAAQSLSSVLERDETRREMGLGLGLRFGSPDEEGILGAMVERAKLHESEEGGMLSDASRSGTGPSPLDRGEDEWFRVSNKSPRSIGRPPLSRAETAPDRLLSLSHTRHHSEISHGALVAKKRDLDAQANAQGHTFNGDEAQTTQTEEDDDDDTLPDLTPSPSFSAHSTLLASPTQPLTSVHSSPGHHGNRVDLDKLTMRLRDHDGRVSFAELGLGEPHEENKYPGEGGVDGEEVVLAKKALVFPGGMYNGAYAPSSAPNPQAAEDEISSEYLGSKRNPISKKTIADAHDEATAKARLATEAEDLQRAEWEMREVFWFRRGEALRRRFTLPN